MTAINKSILIIFVTFSFLTSCSKEDSLSDKREDNGILLDIPLSGSLQNPAFSPDNKSIVFTRFINGYNKEPAELYKYNLSTKKLSSLVSDGSANVNLPGSIWNKTTNQIVFSSSRGAHDEIYLIAENGTTGNEVQITNRLSKVAYEPSLNPNGDWTVFESHLLDQEKNGIIVKYKIDGSSDYMQLTNNGEDCRQPNWSSNNTKILYQKFEKGQWDIWTMDTDGSDKLKVTSGVGDKTDAIFNNNSHYIIYSTDFELDLSNIYKIAIQGGIPTRLTNYKGYDGAPSISSNGKKLIFESSNIEPDNSDGTHLVLVNL
jgi:TolB protein